jgi:hypothetical protein
MQVSLGLLYIKILYMYLKQRRQLVYTQMSLQLVILLFNVFISDTSHMHSHVHSCSHSKTQLGTPPSPLMRYDWPSICTRFTVATPP